MRHVRRVEPPHGVAAEHELLAVGQRARRPVGEVVTDTIAATRLQSGTRLRAPAASNSFSAPHSSASKCENPT